MHASGTSEREVREGHGRPRWDWENKKRKCRNCGQKKYSGIEKKNHVGIFIACIHKKDD